jgi:ATP-dependent protease HslVU (ClpYQ) peptidase subunit
MTTIAAIQGDGWVVMGADSQGTYYESKRLLMSGEKVYNNNGILIAGCGMGRGLDLLHKAWTAPRPTRKNMTVEQLDIWMARTFIPKMRQLFIDSGYDMKDDGDYAQHDSVFIIAVQGVVFIIDDDYSFDREIRKVTTSGSGGDYAQGSLFSSEAHLKGKIFRDIDTAKEAMKLAIDAARAFDVYSGGESRIYVQEA